MTETERSDRQEFEALVRRHQAQVCGVAYAVLRDRSRAEEVAQDAFLIAWRDRAASTPSARWLCGIARNLARNAARRRRESSMTDDPASPARDARDELIDREDAARADAALARLPDKYREAVVLYYGGDESIADVASALGISEDSARQRVHRGRARLRDLLATVETALRATRPTAAFTAACVAAWSAGKPAHAATMPKRPLVPLIGAGFVVLAAGVATVATSRDGQHVDRMQTASRTSSTTDPRAALHRRFGASPRPLAPGALPRNVLAIGTPTGAASSAPSLSTAKLVELDFQAAPFADLMSLFRNELEVPIWVAYETDATIDINTHGKRPAIDVLDEVLGMANANREEVAAIRVVPGGRTDAVLLGGETVSLSIHSIPLNFVLDLLEPKLGMPIGRLGTEVLPGQTDGEGRPVVEQSPLVSLEVQDVSAGAALQQALTQAGVGYELTTGFVILPQ
ncbi:MAG: RNA polymerase sigma factor [Kofleriaceae bacterium]|nr:RNA polymerase sigma factor [Kofleriaceae bacterium]